MPITPRTTYVNGFPSFFDPLFTIWMGIARALGTALALGIIALMVASLWAQPLGRVTSAITATPAAAGGFGLLTLITGVILMIITAITICLSPVTVIIALLYTLAIVFGWIAVGTLIGERMAVTFNWHRLSPAMAAGVGTAIFSLVSALVGLVPCLGAVINIAFASIGMGAVLLTRFGGQMYPLGGSTTVAPPPAPSSNPTAIA
jgi:hypothetical protein